MTRSLRDISRQSTAARCRAPRGSSSVGIGFGSGVVTPKRIEPSLES